MLDVSVDTEGSGRHVRVTEAELTGLVRRIGGDGDRFLVVGRIPDLPDEFAQVWHEDGGGYTLEYRDGGNDRHFRVEMAEPGVVGVALVGWARRDDGWEAGLAWALAEFPASTAEPTPPLDLDDEERGLLTTRLRELLVGGYTTRAELAEVAEDYLVSGDRRPVSREQARELADRMWLERVEEQASWVGVTDPERVALAFGALGEVGITAREHFACCRGCGEAEIGAEAEPGARGFVFFHAQCTDGAAVGGGLTLLYGGFDGSAETTAAIGAEVAAAVRAVGLAVDWDGDPRRALEVVPLDWRKRLVG